MTLTELKPFMLPGWDGDPVPVDVFPKTRPNPQKSEQQRSRKPRKRAHQKRRRWVTVLLWALLGALVLGGAGAAYLGISQQGHVEQAPVPPTSVKVKADAPVNGADGNTSVDTNAGPMTVEKMQPLHYFVPALGAYSEIVPSDGFEATRYSNFDSIVIPFDDAKSVWYSGGGSLGDNAPGTTGTTMFASHVTNGVNWGVLRYLYALKGGELVYAKDAAGKLTAWKVTEVYTKFHTDFPQEYWSAAGVRQLVLVTCGDYDPASGNYLQNVFAVAVPVDPVTGQPVPEKKAETTPAPSATTALSPGAQPSGAAG